MTDESIPVAPDPGQPEIETEETLVVIESSETTSLVEEVPVESAPAEETKVVGGDPDKRTLLFVAFIVLLVLLLIAGLFGLRSCKSKEGDTQLGVAGRMIEAPITPAPAVPNGVQSWTEYKTAADGLDADRAEGNIMYESLALLHPEQGDIRKAVATMASLETSGQTFMYVAPKGAAYINTDYHVISGKLDYRFFEDVTKNNETTFLTFADGTVAVKAGCANAVRFHKTVPAVRKVRVEKPKPKKGKKDKGPDTTGGAAHQPLHDGNAVKTGTTGYPGKAEEVAAEQQRTKGSTGNNGQVGHTGPAVPGTNSSGETNLGGGPAETAPTGGVETPKTGDPGPPN